MKNTLLRLQLSIFALLLTLGACGPSLETQALSAAAGKELYYAIEMRGTVCGYAHLTTSPLPGEGRTEVLLDQDIYVKTSLLGSGLDSETEITYHLDPEHHRFSYFTSEVRQGPIRRTAEVSVEGDVVRFSSSLLGREKTVALGEDVLLENTLFYPHLEADFAGRDLAEKTYRIFEVDDAAVQEVTYRRVGDEALELLGRSWDAVVLDRLNRVTGFKARLWIDRERGLLLQSRLADGASYSLTDAGVPRRIESAALDDNILRETEVSIADIVGEYRNRDAGMTVEVRVQDGSLILDIPDQTLLAVHDPDSDGRWFAKLSHRVFVTFSDDGPAGAGELRLHERLRMRRTQAPDEVPGAGPPELVPYLGTYHLAKARADFTVLYRGGGLALRQPGVGRALRLEPEDEEGRWGDELGRHLRFETDQTGAVAGLELETVTPFERGGA